MRHELTDYEWTAIRPMLPNKPRGVPRVNDRRVLNGIFWVLRSGFWVLRSGAPWRDLPDDFGPYTTCYNRFVRWRRAGVWSRIMNALATAHDASVQMIDTSIVRVHQHGACIVRNRRQSMGRSRGGLTSKIHAVVDTNGLPVRLALTAGEAHDNRLADKLLSRLKSGSMLLADRGYDADWIRALAARKGALANIPPRCNRAGPICFSPYLYRARNLVERFFNKIKHCRRIATRYDKLAANYLAFVQLASIRLWLRVNESTVCTAKARRRNHSADFKGWTSATAYGRRSRSWRGRPQLCAPRRCSHVPCAVPRVRSTTSR
jgi:transposase